MSDYFKFHENEQKNPHYFLCEELLVPRTNNCDTQRLNLFANHINQLVHLTNPEYPKVFTNFENQIGEYSIAYKKAEEDFTVIKKIVKNKYNYDLIIRYNKSRVYDILHYSLGKNITESYGYRTDDCIPNVSEADVVKKGTMLYKAPNYDEDGNFGYGVNLKSVYSCWFGKTYEDGVVLSQSAAEKLKSFKAETTMFSLNTNDTLLNLYGDSTNYKAFPGIGEYVHNNILVASRRKDKRSILYDFQSKHLREIDPGDDEVIYTSGGLVYDINIYSNTPLATMKEFMNEASAGIVELYEDQLRYWRELRDELEKIIPCRDLKPGDFRYELEKDYVDDRGIVCIPIHRDENPNEYTDELAYYWKLSHEALNENIGWRYDRKRFANIKLEFKLLKENPLTAGAKITGRYGNKGIVSEIVPDDQMPTTETGERAEVLLNALGRNFAQVKIH